MFFIEHLYGKILMFDIVFVLHDKSIHKQLKNVS